MLTGEFSQSVDDHIESRILQLRGQRVMIDADLAELLARRPGR
jgi:hypothetical protein